jgi:hypothetical protein
LLENGWFQPVLAASVSNLSATFDFSHHASATTAPSAMRF